jgi:hypothetical protein
MLATKVHEYVGGICLCLGNMHAGFQTTDNAEEVRGGALSVECERNPEIDVTARKLEVGRHHSDDLRRGVIKVQLPAHDVLIAAETSLPERIAEHTDLIVTLNVFTFDKSTSQQRTNTENFEIVDGNVGNRESLWLTVSSQIGGVAVVECN